MEFNMKPSSILMLSMIGISSAYAFPQFSDYPVIVSNGPFAKSIELTDTQQRYTDKWKHIMQRELVKPVNFAGHYRLYLSWNGELPKECGDDRWVCGWIIDKTTGSIVSELPEFNGNTHYRPYHANGTPVPEAFSPGFYPDNSMLWMNGNTAPKSNLLNLKCNYISYNFKNNNFTTLEIGDECDVDHGG
ncbi:hypothetical protein [Lelliottia wanjuensis]|uniref:hypothetical protein n=1 Tax=Lelliottia wanjuensis TaxID=3050585 RepID=UPI002551BF99|nr:hypothetical protein [Lelliottia sp. V104_15]MDK9605827.1 hypothetical protein [Lelliottia sp. V104_15]